MTIGNHQNALIRIPFEVKHILQIKEQIQILNDKINFFRIDLVTVLTAFLTSRQNVKYVQYIHSLYADPMSNNFCNLQSVVCILCQPSLMTIQTRK